MLRIKNAILGDYSAAEALPTVTEGEAAEQFPALLSPTISVHHDNTPSQVIPQWLRELNSSRAMRHSRASSIVSTRTKFSTNTLQEDTRSIDINVAGQYFRISRDGSRITVDDPPPYTGPGVTVRFRSGQMAPVARSDWSEATQGDDNDDELSDTEHGARTPRSTSTTIDTNTLVGANILDPSEFEMPSPVGPDQLSHRSSTRTLVGSGSHDDLGVSDHSQGSFANHGDDARSMQRLWERAPISRATMPPLRAPTVHSLPATPNRRMQLPALVTSNSTRTISNPASRPLFPRTEDVATIPQIQSAGPVLSRLPDEREPRSPDYIGHNARGIFPSMTRSTALQVSGMPNRPFEMGANRGSRAGFLGVEESSDPHTPLSMDTENDISMHYASMMRKLDYEHRKALHLKDKELADMRVRLHEKDTVLRQQLRAKDFMIDDLKQRLSNLEENVDGMLEKARNQVEDLWECRWKDRDFHLRERMRRIEEDAHKMIEKFRAGQAEANDTSVPSAVAN